MSPRDGQVSGIPVKAAFLLAALLVPGAPVVAQTPEEMDRFRRELDADKRYLDCMQPALLHSQEVMEQAAILYPRFGVAWHEQAEAMKGLKHDSPTYKADAKAIHDQFVDRMLRTAEPEAIELYNLNNLNLKNAYAACGPAPPVTPFQK